MSSREDYEASQDSADKGKRRAQNVTETTPLLLPASSSSYVDHNVSLPEARDRQLHAKLTFIFLATLSLCVIFFVILALLAWSYAVKVSGTPLDEISKKALVVEGPFDINIVNYTITEDVWIRVDTMMGLDAGSLIGVKEDGNEDGPLSKVWKYFGRWGISQMDEVSIDVSSVQISSTDDYVAPLAFVNPQPFVIPLAADPPPGKTWLSRTRLLFLIRLTHNTSDILHFLHRSWEQGYIDLRADIAHALVRGGGIDERSWRRFFHQGFSHIRAEFSRQIPPIPGLPPPGKGSPFPPISDLVTLKSFRVYSKDDDLKLHASATVIDPAPSVLNFTTPSLPFVVSLPSSSNASSALPVPVASVNTVPFTLTHPNITMEVTGSVLPLGSKASTSLSTFLTRYLSAEANPILISSPLLPDYFVETLFPAPVPRPQILHNVTIRDMKIKLGTPILASGVVSARVVLPKGIDVKLYVTNVLPDVLVFDGDIPETLAAIPPPSPLPDPLPERAFGYIRPEDWVPSRSTPGESHKGEGSVYTITARIIDVPLQVLPGRQKELSNFVGKVLFNSNGAVAGIMGSAAIQVGIHGLLPPDEDNVMELSGLPFRGNVHVRKNSMLSGVSSDAS